MVQRRPARGATIAAMRESTVALAAAKAAAVATEAAYRALERAQWAAKKAKTPEEQQEAATAKLAANSAALSAKKAEDKAKIAASSKDWKLQARAARAAASLATEATTAASKVATAVEEVSDSQPEEEEDSEDDVPAIAVAPPSQTGALASLPTMDTEMTEESATAFVPNPGGVEPSQYEATWHGNAKIDDVSKSVSMFPEVTGESSASDSSSDSGSSDEEAAPIRRRVVDCVDWSLEQPQDAGVPTEMRSTIGYVELENGKRLQVEVPQSLEARRDIVGTQPPQPLPLRGGLGPLPLFLQPGTMGEDGNFSRELGDIGKLL